MVKILENHPEDPTITNQFGCRPTRYQTTSDSMTSSFNEKIEISNSPLLANGLPLTTKTSSNESTNSNYSDDFSLNEDFHIPETTSCKVVRTYQGYNKFSDDPQQINQIYKNDNSFLFFKVGFGFFKRG